MKKYFSLSLILLLILIVSGCSNDQQSSSNITENKSPAFCLQCHTSDIEHSDEICPKCGWERFCENCSTLLVKTDGSCHECGYRENTLSQYDAEYQGGVFIKSDEGFTPIACVTLSGPPLQDERMGATYDLESDIPVFDSSSNEQLVTFNAAADYEIYPVIDQMYCYPVEVVDAGSNGINFNRVPLLDCEHIDDYTEEVEGHTITSMDDLDSAISAKGCFIYAIEDDWLFSTTTDFICSTEPTSLVGGYWSGTSFIEYNIDVNASFYSLGNMELVEVEKTKDGYFVVDTSQLAPGRYVINVNFGNGNGYHVFDVI